MLFHFDITHFVRIETTTRFAWQRAFPKDEHSITHLSPLSLLNLWFHPSYQVLSLPILFWGQPQTSILCMCVCVSLHVCVCMFSVIWKGSHNPILTYWMSQEGSKRLRSVGYNPNILQSSEENQKLLTMHPMSLSMTSVHVMYCLVLKPGSWLL